MRLVAVTLACASLFLGVKAVEYSHKWDKGLLWAGAYANATPHVADAHETHAADASGADHGQHTQAAWLSTSLLVLSVPFALAFSICGICYFTARVRNWPHARAFWLCCWLAAASFFVGVFFGQVVESFASHDASAVVAVSADELAEQQKYTGVFFSIYYAMTGVHALHILIGMGVIAWILWRSIRHDFDGDYFGPVDFTALYWHLVDLVWVYLFPLLYLIR